MVHYKLNYFNLRGRAEVARMMFAEAQVEFEDHRIEQEDWPKEKSSMILNSYILLSLSVKYAQNPIKD